MIPKGYIDTCRLQKYKLTLSQDGLYETTGYKNRRKIYES